MKSSIANKAKHFNLNLKKLIPQTTNNLKKLFSLEKYRIRYLNKIKLKKIKKNNYILINQ